MSQCQHPKRALKLVLCPIEWKKVSSFLFLPLYAILFKEGKEGFIKKERKKKTLYMAFTTKKLTS